MIDEYDAVLDMICEGGPIAQCLVGEAEMQDLSGEESLAYILAAVAELQAGSEGECAAWMRARIAMHNAWCFDALGD